MPLFVGHHHRGSVTENRSDIFDFILIPIGIRKTDQLFSISVAPSAESSILLSFVTYLSRSLRPRYRRR